METIEKNNLQTDQEMNEKHFSQGSIADFRKDIIKLFS